VVGDTLLDRDVEGRSERLCPDTPAPVVEDPDERARPGGAALAAVLAARDGHQVTLVTALGADEAGAEVARLLAAAGVEVVDLGLRGPTPEKVRVRAAGHTVARVDRGGRDGAGTGPLPEPGRRALAAASAVVVSDYGRGLVARADVREALAGLGRAPVVWDPHPRGPQPVAGARVVTPNEHEARRFAPGVEGAGLAATVARARDLVARWSVRAVCVTRGEEGALLVEGGGPPLAVPAARPVRGDACGAGDRFASAAAGRLAAGALLSEAVTGAVRAASAFVVAGGAAALDLARPPAEAAAGDPAVAEAEDVVARVRARGGVVVATGGCFDLLHAGHVTLLSGARSLGDCLVVCLNSDESVRRLKGPGRPVVGQDDRAKVLLALGCVDAVVTFDDDTPVPVLERLRPDIFAKGSDYAGTEIPEVAVVRQWGGQVVVLPYVEGRSTTRILDEAGRRGD
jgi:rfaE bifunctional protein nucleotidyltransferase chain/domain/rfaE bifunctional protein kinase chain/domain